MPPTPLPTRELLSWPTEAPLRAWLLPLTLFGLFWWVLSGGEWQSWVIGLPAVLIAAGASLALHWPVEWRLSLLGVLRFIPFFFWRSLVGSIDVASRALAPGMPLSPSFQRYRLRLPPESLAKVLFVNTLGLLPGTFTAELQEEELVVHVLDAWDDIRPGLEELENAVARIFGIELAESAVEDR